MLRRFLFLYIVSLPRFDGHSSTYGVYLSLVLAVHSAAYLARQAARCTLKRRADYVGNPLQGLPSSSYLCLCHIYLSHLAKTSLLYSWVVLHFFIRFCNQNQVICI